MSLHFTMPIITLREAEKGDAAKIEGASWQYGSEWGWDQSLIVDDKQVDYVLELGESGAIIPVIDHHINYRDGGSHDAQVYFCEWLAETMTKVIRERS